MDLIGYMVGAFALLQAANAATTYTVGDTAGWSVPTNSVGFYESWAANKTFHIGDSIVFKWSGAHTATEVGSEEDYNKCSKTGIANIKNGEIVALKANGTRYFVCAVGSHCALGQKVSIKVGNAKPQPPTVAPSSAHFSAGSSLLLALLSSLPIFINN